MKHLLTRWLSIQNLFKCSGCYTRDSDNVTLHADYRVDFERYIHTYVYEMHFVYIYIYIYIYISEQIQKSMVTLIGSF